MNNFTGLFIALCWAAFFVYMVISAFSVKRTVEVVRGWTWSWLILAIVVGALLLFKYFVHLRVYVTDMVLWPRTVITDVIAGILVISGLGIALWGRIALGRNWNMYPALKENHELIERGPYAYVRHPMYSGLLLMFLGTVIWYATVAGIAIFVASLLGTWFKLRQEEKLLTKHFGECYLNYKARVKALIPFVL
ncbi:MAG: methyltransferase family protein [Dissulfurispiraceae bacterium]